MTLLFTSGATEDPILEVFEDEPGLLTFELSSENNATIVIEVDAADFARQLIGGSRTVATGVGEVVQRAILSAVGTE